MHRDRRYAYWLCLALAVGVVGGCGGTTAESSVRRTTPAPRARVSRQPTSRRRAVAHKRPQALVTAETDNELLVVDLRTGIVRRRIPVPGGPQYVAAETGVAAVSSPGAGEVTVLEGPPLHAVRVLRGFGAPEITELAPDGQHVYVTDGARGTLTVLTLGDRLTTHTLSVGAGAHHMSSSPDQRRLWIALGESARTIVIVDTTDLSHPVVIGRFDPGFPVHDLSFSPNGARVWVTSSAGPDVVVYRASDHRPLFRVPVGTPPQHVAFGGRDVYLTSGYGRTIERVNAATGRVLARASTPYGSFELAVADGYVATASLLNGELAIYTPALKLLRVVKLAPATRDVAIAAR